MAANSKIEWTDATWNPIRARNLKTGKIGWHCEHVTSGCEFCYAESMNKRLGTGLPFKPGHRKDIEIFLDEKMLVAPLRWKKPRMIFVCSMTDAFADFVKDEWLDKIFAVMALCPQHTFQVLPKRPERMREYMSDPLRKRAMGQAVMGISNALAAQAGSHLARITIKQFEDAFTPDGKPFPNVWLGTSCENQATADDRIPILLDTPAAIRFVSLEPLLGSIDLREVSTASVSAAAGNKLSDCLHWVIVGGESGPNARPMHPGWARSLRDQCMAAGVPFFFKQWGEHCASESAIVGRPPMFRRIGKKAAGRLLDGVEHNGMPR
jgi:protein gp37